MSVEEYEYDFAGNRTAKITEDGVTHYVVDTNGVISQVLYETDKDNNLTTFYTRGLDLISLSRADEERVYLYDGHGNVRALADEKGAVTDTYDYDAFGNLISQTGKTVNNYLYCGEQFDACTGFYYLRARYMNPSTGTFISMDSFQGSMFDPMSLHKYLYANANPVSFVDPTGNYTLAETSACGSIQDSIDGMLEWNVLGLLRGAVSRIAKITLLSAPAVLIFGDEIFDICQSVANGLATPADVSTSIREETIDRVIPYELSKKFNNPRVVAEFHYKGKIYIDSNPKGRLDYVKGVAGSIIEGIVGEKGLTIVNKFLGTAHAEIGAMNQALSTNDRGGMAELYVYGDKICSFCKIDIKKMALKLQLDYLTVFEVATGKKYKFNSLSDFNVASKGGKGWINE